MSKNININGSNIEKLNIADNIEITTIYNIDNARKEIVDKLASLLFEINNTHLEQGNKKEIIENLRNLTAEAKINSPNKTKVKGLIKNISDVIAVGGNLDRIHSLWKTIIDSEWVKHIQP